MGSWSFLSDHDRVLVLLVHDPGMGPHDVAAALGVTERWASGIVADLTAGGSISEHKERRRYQALARRPLPELISRERIFGEVLALFPGTRPAASRVPAPLRLPPRAVHGGHPRARSGWA
ncbi:MAG TPA: hypothetical protein VGS19_32745 [Streptosporangiaceae bacterium]|nr:hypothetical protein [Streptosporangiaceae bacterium]